jgi:YD repeat-containing protein
MKNSKRILSLALALILVFALSLPAAAKQGSPAVSIAYRGIKITLDGKKIVPVDAAGKAVEPFIMAGTTYLPVRAVAGALGLDAAWNDGTSTVALTSGGTVSSAAGDSGSMSGQKTVKISYRSIKLTLDGKTLTPVDAAGMASEPFIMDGSTYLPVRAVAGALGLGVNWDNGTSTVELTSAGTAQPGEPAQSGGRWLLTGVKNYLLQEGSAPVLDNTETYTYDKTGRPLSSVRRDGAGNMMTSSTFVSDSAGRVTRENVNTGRVTDYTYDGQGRLTGISYTAPSQYEGSGGSVHGSESFSYDAQGRLVKHDMGTPADNSYTSYVYAYDAAGRCVKQTMTGRTVSDSGTSEVSGSLRAVYTAGTSGLPAKAELFSDGKTAASTTWSNIVYNASARTVSYELTASPFGYSPISMGSLVYSFDKNGCLTGIKSQSSNIIYTYAWYPGSANNYIAPYPQMNLFDNSNDSCQLFASILGSAPFAKWK